MRYDFECGSCSRVWEHSCSMSERPDSLPCACGGEAKQIITSVPESFVRGREIQWDKSLCTPSFGRDFGRSDEQQFAMHQKVIGEQRKQAQAWNSGCSAKDKEFEFVGCAPMEAVLSFNTHVGDAEAAQKDPVDLYKRLGTYMGRD